MTKSATVTKKPRKQYSPEYRAEALKLVGRILAYAAARELSLYESQLYAWRSKIQQKTADPDAAKPGEKAATLYRGRSLRAAR
jgi:transposase-like protein